MTVSQIVLLFLASIVGGTLNAVAGGGSFVTLPSLIFAGVLPINANATSTVALWPGALASIGAYRKELLLQKRTQVLLLSGTSLVGGVLGAFLLLSTSQSTFIRLLPYLLLVATVLFAVSGPLTTRMREHAAEKRADLLKERVAGGEVVEQTNTAGGYPTDAVQNRTSWLKLSGIAVLQFIIAIYGGYFGGGIGILMLATLGLMGMENIHEMNAMKTLLAACINGVAVVIFVAKGVVEWPQAILMVLGAIIGGFGGAYFARKLNPLWVRWFVIAVGVGMTIYFFVFP